MLLACFSGGVNADNKILLNVESASPLIISAVRGGHKVVVIIPVDVVRSTEDIYTTVTLDDLDGDGASEVVMTISAGEGVNYCSRVFRYSLQENSLTEVEFSEGNICNYRKEGDYLFSSYRGASKWVEDIYKFDKGSFDLVYKDACIGCGYVSRRAFGLGEGASSYLVSDSESLRDRKPIVGSVLSRRALVYSAPSINHPSKKYLVKGDRFLVLGFLNSNEEDWVKFRYRRKVVTEGWLRCTDVEQCIFP